MSYYHFYYNSESEEREAIQNEKNREDLRKYKENKSNNFKRFNSCLDTNPYK